MSLLFSIVVLGLGMGLIVFRMKGRSPVREDALDSLREKDSYAEPRVSTAVGSKQSQELFVGQNQAFIAEYPRLHALSSQMFIRDLSRPLEEEIAALSNMPNDDPSVVNFENRVIADRIIFFLGRIAVDDFGEILTLTANGFGFGAYKILRGMYERVVTAMYIAKKPAEARIFAEHSPIMKWKLLQRSFEAFPEMKNRLTKEELNTFKAASDAAKLKQKESICPKCKQPTTQEAWTRVNLDQMAAEVDEGLAKLYGQFYLEGTAQSHANVFGLERRLKEVDGGGWTYKETSEEEGQFALNLGHSLVIRALDLENKHFALGLDAEIQERVGAYASIWKPVDRAATTQN